MKAVKWVLIGLAGIIVIVIGALLIIPMFVDVQKYKPEIEKQVSQAIGCPFSIGGELKLSLFPWAGIAFSDLRMGNPPGFKEKDLLAVKSFDVKVKLMPLLSKDIQVNRFVVEGLKVALEKNKAGKGNWEAIGKPAAKIPPAKPREEKRKEPQKGPLGELPIKSLAVGEMAVRNGNILWINAATGERKEIKDLGLELKDVSLDRPIAFALSASLDGKPLRVDGKVGPLGKGSIPLDVAVKVFKELSLNLKGTVSDALGQPRFDLAMDLAPFSPRKLVSALGQAFPVATADPNALTKVGLRAQAKGNASSVSLTDGTMDMDQSKITFSAAAKDFAKPDVNLRMNIDQIDVDRYLPPAAEKKPAADKPAAPAPAKKKTDYGPLRKLVVDAEIRAGKVKVMGAQVQDVFMKLKGRDGVFHVDPFALKAYQGSLTTKANLDVRADKPKTAINLDTAGVKVRPLLNDVMKKDFLEGTTQAKMTLRMEGEDADTIKKTLNGNGELRFTDGAIIGIDLPGMVRNVKSAFGGEKPAERPKTDFSELLAPFTIKDGLVNTPGTSMASPLLRVVATGKADLVKETLDMRVEPKVVGTLKGQQDTKERSGIMIPVLVTGTFSSPSFAPDLKGVIETGIKERLKSPEGIRELLKGGDSAKETAPTTPKDRAKEILKGLFGK
ncbi:MAG: AsmA family protein [Thermodesulfobacteriota bacterium]